MDPHDPQLREMANRAMNLAQRNATQHRMLEQPLDVRHIEEWPEVDFYGPKHAQEVSELAVQVFHRIPREIDNQREYDYDVVALKWAGMLHDIGRTQPWRKPDPHHGQRSAEMAERLLRDDSRNFNDDGLHAYVVKTTPWLIANHNLGAERLPTDPRLQALWDADSLEAARLGPGTRACLEEMKKRYGRLCTPWAQMRETQQRWRRYRGW